MSHNKLLGGVLIIAGTTIGGGMLALPLASAFAGFSLSVLVLIGIWALMTYTALITLEMNLYFQKGVSISYAAAHTLGKLGKRTSTFAIAILFYALLSAYISGGSSICNQIIYSFSGLSLPPTLMILIFAVIFSSIILAKTRVVDVTNRWLLLVKVGCFIAMTAIILPQVDIELLSYIPPEITPQLSGLIPLFFTSFGFHGSIPSVINYIGLDPKKLRFTFIVGSLTPLVVYILWEILVLGSVPLDGVNSFASIKAVGGDVGTFTNILSNIAGGSWIIAASQGFTLLAIATSFLGVGLGLFDFIEEQLTDNNKKPATYITGLCTFVLPIVFSIFYPQGFMIALGYAAIALSILAVIMPALTVWKLRSTTVTTSYTTIGGKAGLLLALLGGVGIILLELDTILR